jgi:hypothetical protein
VSLLDDLKEAAKSVDPQYQPTSNEQGPVLAALALFVEYGQQFLDAAQQGSKAVADLIAPAPAEAPAVEPAAPAPTAAAPTDEELAAQIADLQAQQAARQATAQQTTVEHEPA